MSATRLSKRRLKKQLRYAAQGMATGLIASLALISGTIVISRLIVRGRIGYGIPFAFAFFTVVLIVMIYRLWNPRLETGRSRRSVTSVTELSADDKTKSA